MGDLAGVQIIEPAQGPGLEIIPFFLRIKTGRHKICYAQDRGCSEEGKHQAHDRKDGFISHLIGIMFHSLLIAFDLIALSPDNFQIPGPGRIDLHFFS